MVAGPGSTVHKLHARPLGIVLTATQTGLRQPDGTVGSGRCGDGLSIVSKCCGVPVFQGNTRVA